MFDSLLYKTAFKERFLSLRTMLWLKIMNECTDINVE